MVAGHLSEKNGYFYSVLSYIDAFGNRKTKWISTGLTVKGNKKRAEALLAEERRNFKVGSKAAEDMLFADYLEQWLVVEKSSLAPSTYGGYEMLITRTLAPYFRKKDVTLSKLSANHIQQFYSSELLRVSASTVNHYHALLHKALKYAVKHDLLDINPADKVERPKVDHFSANFYDAAEMSALFDASKGNRLEIPILLGAFYGLRRSEVIGLRWDALDFNSNTISIKHTVTSVTIDGKRTMVASDTTKTKSSMRTLPLVPFVRDKLMALKDEQAENKRLCGKAYNKEYDGYICVNAIGQILNPHYVTTAFPKLLKAKGLRKIRFHDLRHSCASLMLANGVPMKQIQEWLGHSDYSTTANLYVHLDYSSKLNSADAMLSGLGLQ